MIDKAKIEDGIYDVVSFEEYASNKTHFSPKYTAIKDGDTIYPIRGRNDTRPGMYLSGPICKFVEPTEEEKPTYSSSNIIDFNNVETIKDIIEKQNKLKSAETSILTTIDNVFIPRIDENDYPEMVGLKEAVIAKGIDLDKYEQRFGPNFNNDKRLFNKNSITMTKFKTMCNVLDIKATLIIEDKDENVPNPIGHKIIVDLTSSENQDGSEGEE